MIFESFVISRGFDRPRFSNYRFSSLSEKLQTGIFIDTSNMMHNQFFTVLVGHFHFHIKQIADVFGGENIVGEPVNSMRPFFMAMMWST